MIVTWARLHQTARVGDPRVRAEQGHELTAGHDLEMTVTPLGLVIVTPHAEALIPWHGVREVHGRNLAKPAKR